MSNIYIGPICYHYRTRRALEIFLEAEAPLAPTRYLHITNQYHHSYIIFIRFIIKFRRHASPPGRPPEHRESVADSDCLDLCTQVIGREIK